MLERSRPNAPRTSKAAAPGSGAPSLATPEALPQLLELGQNDANVGVRANAVIAVGYVGAEAKSVVPFLIERLKENDGDIQCAAALALIQMGPAAKDAVPAVLAAWKSSGGPMLRDYAMDALQKIDPPTAANPWR